MAEAKTRSKKAVPADPVLDTFLEFPLEKLVLRDQNVRSEYTQMDEISASIRAEGVIQPLTAVPILDDAGVWTGTGELVAGYRRYYAAQKAQLKTVPVRFVNADEQRRHRLAMIENLQRVDMNPMDRARGIQKMLADGQLDQKGVASSLGVSEGYVSQHLSLLKLPAQVQTAVRNAKLEMTHARTLGRLKEEEAILGMLKEAQTLTAADLTHKVEFVLAKEKEKVAKAAVKTASTETKSSTEESRPPARAKKSLAEQYADAELQPLNKTDLRNELQARAEKLQNAKTEGSRTEHKFVLKGLEIAAGLK